MAYVQQQSPVYTHGAPVGGPQPVTMVVAAPMVVMAPASSQPWKTPICETCTEAPSDCCYVLCCPHCAVYQQRKRLLAFTGEPYSCCQRESLPRAGNCCDSPYQPPARSPPAEWPPQVGSSPMLDEFNGELCMEVCCCPTLAALSTRWLMQYKFRVVNSCCDSCLVCAGASGVGNVSVDDGNGNGGNSGGLLFACVVTQATIQLREEEAKRARGQPTWQSGQSAQVLLMAGAPQQQMMGHPAAGAAYTQSPPPPSYTQPQYAQPQQYHQQQQQQYQQQPQYYQQDPYHQQQQQQQMVR